MSSTAEQIRKSSLFRCICAILTDFSRSCFPSIYFWTERKTHLKAGVAKWSNKEPDSGLFYKIDRSELFDCEQFMDVVSQSFAVEIVQFLEGEDND